MKDRELSDLLRGRTVSMDVSTEDHDSGHRIFGTVIGIEDGVIICEFNEVNFADQ